MQTHSRQWSRGAIKYCWSRVVATDDVIEVVTQFVLAGATAGKPIGMRVPKHASGKIDLERVHQIADACPDLIERIADTEIHEE